jgi:oxygen-dependent protoporphyrinogen oxidase
MKEGAQMATIVVIGGGISGLSVALHIADQRPDLRVRLLEASNRLGGVIHTDRDDGWVCEAGPGAFIDRHPSTRRLIDRLGLSGDIISAGNAIRRRYIRHQGRLHPFPDSPEALARTALLSEKGRRRMQFSPVLPPQSADQTVSEFATAHLGKEAAAMLVDPIVAGIYAGASDQLSARSVLPQLVGLANNGGRVCDALLGQGQGRLGKGSMVSISGGLGSMVEALEAHLGDRIERNRTVTKLRRAPGCWEVSIDDGECIEAEVVVFTAHGHAAKQILGPIDSSLDDNLGRIPSAPVAVVNLGFAPGAIDHPLDGFGYLIPSSEGGSVLGVKWTTSIFPQGRAPEAHTLMQVFVGGTRDPDLVRDVEGVVAAARAEISQTLGIKAKPVHTRVFAHRVGISQYTAGHTERVLAIEKALKRHPGLYLAGTTLHGVGINAVTTQAESVVEALIEHLGPAEARASGLVLVGRPA